MGAFEEPKGKAEQAAGEHPEQTEKISDQATQKAGDAADNATGDKYSSQVDSAQKRLTTRSAAEPGWRCWVGAAQRCQPPALRGC
jgi:hypothetical protein